MALPGVPLRALVALLFTTTMFTPPFESARSAIIPGILHGELYPLGAALINTTLYAAHQVRGAGGAAAVALLGVRPSLAIDAATFMLSALLIGLGIGAAGRRRAGICPVVAAGLDAGRIPAGIRRQALRTC